MSETYSISQLAQEFEVTTRTIRFYEDKGMLCPDRRGQTRIFSAADRTKLRLILRGKRLGLTLEESRDIIEMYQPGGNNSSQLTQLISKIRERRNHLGQQMLDLKIMMTDLEKSERRCVDALNALSPNNHDATPNNVPPIDETPNNVKED